MIGDSMIPSNRIATHPGAILLKGKRGISPDTAWLLSGVKEL
jgi:hypothetical protein